MGKNKNKKKKWEKVTVTGKTTSTPASKVEELKATLSNKPFELRFSPTAWSKLLYLRDIGDTEIGGFGITRPDDLLYVEDFITVKQECTMASVDFDDQDVSDFALDMAEEGLQPENYLRIWIHTHPGSSPTPSGTDEQTFSRVFGKCDWAVMAIVAKGGDTYCRLKINDGPVKGSMEVPMTIDFNSYEFAESDFEEWTKEYEKNVTRSYFQHYTGPSNWYKGAPGYNGNGITKSSKQDDVNLIDLEDEDLYNFYGVPGGYQDDIRDTNAPDDDAYDYSHLDTNKQYSVDSISIPSDVEEHIDANTMILLEYMTPYERDYVFDEIRKNFNTGD